MQRQILISRLPLLLLLLTALAGAQDVIFNDGFEYFEPPPNGIPPDPSTIAPEIDPTVATTIDESARFLYQGSPKIQTSVAEGVIEPRRAAIIRGSVMTKEGAPLPGVTVSILGHPELGQTLSRDDGMFDLVVNGGGLLVVEYRLDGYLPAQRRIDVGWQKWAYTPDVALVEFDPNVTQIDLDTLSETAIATGSVQTDVDGSRQAKVFFKPGTSADMMMPDGSTVPLSTISVRATEYTVGENGREAMPGELPLMSGYTYAVELSLDEVFAAGASGVQFSQGIPFYVDNFLDFPVGTAVPIGYYDRESAQWIGLPNGRVIEILGVTGGLADIDADGDSIADTGEQLAELGIDDSERTVLASEYSVGSTLWRSVVFHFTPFDCNWPYGPPADAVTPGQKQVTKEDVDQEQRTKDPCSSNSSIIECENQVLGQRIDLTGTPYQLNYRSNNVPGAPGRMISFDVPLTGPSVPSSLLSVAVVIQIAGHQFAQIYAPAPNLSYHFEWNGRDVYGRTLYGTHEATIRIQYTYPLVYRGAQESINAWSRAGAYELIPERTRDAAAVTINQEYRVPLRTSSPSSSGLGGWSLDAHHLYDPTSRTLHLGNGTQRNANGIGRTVEHFAGDVHMLNYDTFPIIKEDAAVDLAPGMDFGPDGTLYYTDQGHRSVFALGTDGFVRRIAGDGDYCSIDSTTTLEDCGIGGPALDASLGFVIDLAVGHDGTVYITNDYTYIYAIGTDGFIRHISGREGYCPFTSGDWAANCILEGLAQESYLKPYGIDVGPDGALYAADLARASTIARIDPNGTISTVAGAISADYWDSERLCSRDGTPALQTCMAPWEVAVAPDGTIYVLDLLLNDEIGDVTRILEFGADGLMHVVFSSRDVTVDIGWDAYQAFDIDDQGRIYLANERGANPTVYMVDPKTKQVVEIAGGLPRSCRPGNCTESRDGGPALATAFYELMGLAVGPDGAIYVNDYTTIRRISEALPGYDEFNYLIASDDGSWVYEFSSHGRHLRTLSGLTGEALLEFEYNGSGLLASIRQEAGTTDNITLIERGAGDIPTGIVGPFGQRTVLSTDSIGLLATIENPASNTWQFEYDAQGLMQRKVDPAGGESLYGFDSKGLLTSARDAAGGVQTLAVSRTIDVVAVTRVSPGGREHVYRLEQQPQGAIRRVARDEFGAETEVIYAADGSTTTTYPSGDVVIMSTGANPQFGLLSDYASTETYLSPGGLITEVSRSASAEFGTVGDPLSLMSRSDTVSMSGRIFRSEFDRTTLTFTSTSPEGRVGKQTFDSLGRLVQEQIDPTISPRSAIFGERGLVSRTTFGSQSIDFTYDALGRLVSRTDALGAETEFEYDAANRLTAMVLPSGGRFEYTYNMLGNRTSMKMPSGAVHELGYSVLGQDTSYEGPGSVGPLLSEYDADRNVSATVFPSGQRVEYLKDTNGRATGISYADANIGITYANTVTGQVDSLTRTPTEEGATETISFDYDGSIITGYTISGTANASYTFRYDDNLFLAGLTLDDGPEQLVTSDADGLVTGIGMFTFERQGPAGAPSYITDGTLDIDLVFNDEARLVSRTHTVGGVTGYALELTHDAAGRITNRTETINEITRSYDFDYDVDEQLIEVREDGVVIEVYEYDVNGNRTLRDVGGNSAVATFDVQDRITSQGAVTYIVDDDGFLAARGAVTFDYSARGELLEASIPGTGTINYAYDAMNRLVGRTGPDGTTQYLYGDPHNPVILTEARHPDGTLTRYTYDSAGILIALERDSTTFYVGADQVGTPRVVFDDSGALIKSIEYDAWGLVLADSNPGFRLHVGFAGGIVDPDTGLVRFGMRDYDPASGRWTARDPLLYGGGQANLYAYVNNNPVTLRDPMGLGICIGGSYYRKFGGGATFCFDEKGTSLCLEVGFGQGGGPKVNLDGKIADTQGGGADYIELGAKLKCGPISVEGKVKLDDCGVFSVNCPLGVSSYGGDACAGIKNDGDGWTGPTKDKVNKSLKKPGLKDAVKALPDYSPPPIRKPAGTRVADPECQASVTAKAGICGRHLW